LTALLCVALAGPGIYRLLGASLPFMPLVEWESLISLLAAIVLVLGLVAGTLGSLISLRSR
jgi:hypothetical protein